MPPRYDSGRGDLRGLGTRDTPFLRLVGWLHGTKDELYPGPHGGRGVEAPSNTRTNTHVGVVRVTDGASGFSSFVARDVEGVMWMDPHLITLQEYTLRGVDFTLDMRAREWCKMPYPGHPKGCPNYGKHPRCPPHAPLFDEYFDMERAFLVLVAEFDMKRYVEVMRAKHPAWTERKLRNPLYWQNSVRKRLVDRLVHITLLGLKDGGDMVDRTWTLIPEAMGMHVIATMRPLIPITVRPVDRVFKVAVCGYRNADRGVCDGGM